MSVGWYRCNVEEQDVLWSKSFPLEAEILVAEKVIVQWKFVGTTEASHLTEVDNAINGDLSSNLLMIFSIRRCCKCCFSLTIQYSLSFWDDNTRVAFTRMKSVLNLLI